jgi:ABC-2 type transport system permease protein
MNGWRDIRRIYGALLRAGWARALEYRAQALLWVLSAVFPLVMMVVWLAIVAEAGPVSGWGESDFLSYYLAAAFVNQMTFSWTIWQWDNEIHSGDLSAKLLKPLDPLNYYLTEQVGIKVFFLALLGPALVVLAVLSPEIDYVRDPLRWAAFALALLTGYAISLLMTSAFGMLSFWSTQSSNLFSLWWGVGSFLSGWIAPLELFPPALLRTAYWLPFRYTLGFPIEILQGRLAWAEIGLGFGVGLIWTVIFLTAYRLLWRLGLRRYEAVGT